MKLQLRDINQEMVSAWASHFAGLEDVVISQGDIFGATADAIVSPANSFGYMDGGIDLVYVQRFGWQLQHRLQAILRDEHDGELPVGQALIVETNDPEIPYMISAPTMRIPQNIEGTLNAYLAFRGALRAAKDFNRHSSRPIRTILCPGMGTAVGRMPHRIAAQQMYVAYMVVVQERRDFFDRAYKVLYNHAALARGDRIWSEGPNPEERSS